MATETDQQINEMFKIVRAKQEEVATAEKINKQPWKTKCTLHFGLNSAPPINIQSADQDTIKKCVIELLLIREYGERAEVILDMEQSNKYDGFTYEDWIADCKKRITILGLQAKKKILAQLEDRLNAIVSTEQRREMELKAIAETLGV